MNFWLLCFAMSAPSRLWTGRAASRRPVQAGLKIRRGESAALLLAPADHLDLVHRIRGQVADDVEKTLGNQPPGPLEQERDGAGGFNALIVLTNAVNR